MGRAILEREAHCGIYVSATASGFAREIGEFAEGDTKAGRFVACTNGHVTTALRLLLVQERLDRAFDFRDGVNSGLILDQVARLKVALERIKTINRRVTDVRKGADGIDVEARALRIFISRLFPTRLSKETDRGFGPPSSRPNSRRPRSISDDTRAYVQP